MYRGGSLEQLARHNAACECEKDCKLDDEPFQKESERLTWLAKNRSMTTHKIQEVLKKTHHIIPVRASYE